MDLNELEVVIFNCIEELKLDHYNKFFIQISAAQFMYILRMIIKDKQNQEKSLEED